MSMAAFVVVFELSYFDASNRKSISFLFVQHCGLFMRHISLLCRRFDCCCCCQKFISFGHRKRQLHLFVSGKIYSLSDINILLKVYAVKKCGKKAQNFYDKLNRISILQKLIVTVHLISFNNNDGDHIVNDCMMDHFALIYRSKSFVFAPKGTFPFSAAECLFVCLSKEANEKSLRFVETCTVNKYKLNKR